MFRSVNNVKQDIESEANRFRDLQTKLIVLQNDLAKNKEFREFISLQKAVNTKADNVWKDIEQKMIDYNIDTIDIEWVKFTIVHGSTLKVIGIIAPEFTKRVPDTKKINDYIKKTGEVPEGVQKNKNYFLRKSFRQFVS